jgi:HlyD family secretion protein
MKKYSGILMACAMGSMLLYSCKNNEQSFDATGVFEADEVLVSSEIPGRIIQMQVQEGDMLQADSMVAVIDAGNLDLQKQQVEASIGALQQKTNEVAPQLALLNEQLNVQQSQLQTLEKERQRFSKLVAADAATPKQLDDIVAQVEVLKRQMDVTRQQMNVQQSNVAIQNRGILSEREPLAKRAEIIADQINRSRVINPVSGTVLTRYAMQGEMIGAGKALYKIADLSKLMLRAYISGDQLSQIKLGQSLQVFVDSGSNAYRQYEGKIIWIADKAEFTPKTIQTKDERANQVYAVKIIVPNDGYLKIGQYGEVKW